MTNIITYKRSTTLILVASPDWTNRDACGMVTRRVQDRARHDGERNTPVRPASVSAADKTRFPRGARRAGRPRRWRFWWTVAAGAAVGSGLRGPDPAQAASAWTPLCDLRARQEILDGVYHFAPNDNRQWLRLRTRAGLRLQNGRHLGEVLLTNEHRHYLTPDDIAFDWDEVIIERAFWSWQATSAVRLTVGRQDIVWPGGFLMLDGTPLDGARTGYHNAVRVQTSGAAADFDVALIHNPKRDPVVVIDDLDRAVGDADETALAMRLVCGVWAWSFIYKDERDPDVQLPDLTTATFAGRCDGAFANGGTWHGEMAVQYQHGRTAPLPALAPAPDVRSAATGWALAADAGASWPLDRHWSFTAGAFYYSGQTDGGRAFRTPWGRWPKWSDLYLYSLLGESRAGRSHVAAWENIAAPHVTFSRPLGGRLTVLLRASWLLAPEPEWLARCGLTRAELTAVFSRRLQGHLLWETLFPGAFHDGRYGLPPLADTVHFVRWQLVWAL